MGSTTTRSWMSTMGSLLLATCLGVAGCGGGGEDGGDTGVDGAPDAEDTAWGEEAVEFSPSVGNLTVENFEGNGGCHFEYRYSLVGNSTSKACETSTDPSFSPAGRTREMQVTVYTEEERQGPSCDSIEEIGCPEGRRFEIGDPHSYGLDVAKTVKGTYRYWNADGSEDSSFEASSGYIEFDDNCRMTAILKFEDSPVQQTFEYRINEPWSIGETTCRER